MGSVVSIRIKVDASKEVLAAAEKQIELGMRAIGEEAMGYAAEASPVDTGRLRNSMAWATNTASGGGSAPLAQPEKNSAYVGTDVDYAVYNEYGHKSKKHFIKNAMTNHSGEYESTLKAALME